MVDAQEKNKEKVLAGEMILTFQKDGKGDVPTRHDLSKPTVGELVEEALAEIVQGRGSFPGELLFDRVAVKAWNRRTIRSFDLTPE